MIVMKLRLRCNEIYSYATTQKTNSVRCVSGGNFFRELFCRFFALSFRTFRTEWKKLIEDGEHFYAEVDSDFFDALIARGSEDSKNLLARIEE